MIHPASPNPRSAFFAPVLLLVAVVVGSSSAIFVKASGLHPLTLSAARLLIAALLLVPAYRSEASRRRAVSLAPASLREALRKSFVPGLMLALHFISWVYGVRMTTVGNSTLIVNMVPVAMPFVAYFASGTRPRRRELIATAIAMTGVLVLGAGDFALSPGDLVGDLVCIASMLLFAIYLALGTRNNTDGRLWTYLVPLYAVGGLACLLAAAFTPGAFANLTLRNLALAVGLAVGPTIIGHSILNWSMTVLRAQTVSVFNLFQFVFAALFAAAFLGETPSASFWPTIPFILAGALVALSARKADA